MKHSSHNWTALLWDILGWIPWNNEDSDILLYKSIKESPILKPEFIVIDDITRQEVFLMKEFDNPYHSLSTLEAIDLVENALKKVPNTTEYNIDQQQVSSLLLYFNSVRASINWQVSVYNEKYKRYSDALNYFFNVKTKENIDWLEQVHNELTSSLVKELEENQTNKEKDKKEYEEKMNEKREKLEKEMMNDNSVTQVEFKRRLKEFDDWFNYDLKEIDSKYKDKFKVKENEILMNRDLKYKLLSKSFAETLTSSSVEYGEMLRKTRMIQLMKEYFESRSLELNWIIMTLNVIFKNTVNLTWDFSNNRQ